MGLEQLDQYIQVRIKNENYALNISEIHEIIKLQGITGIPKSKPFIKGVINLRGKVVPVISLRKRFAMEEADFTKETRIVVVNFLEDQVGIIVDQVMKVTTFTDIQPPPKFIGNINGSYFSGIGRSENGIVSILKLDEILHV